MPIPTLPPMFWDMKETTVQKPQVVEQQMVPVEQALQQTVQQPITQPKPVMLAQNDLSSYDYNIPLKNIPNFVNNVDTVTGMPKRNSDVSFKGLVFHIPAKENMEDQKIASKKDKSGYNIIIDENGDANYYANPEISAQQIKKPTDSERKAETISEDVRKVYKDWSNSNTLSMGIMGGLTEKNKPTVFDIAARLFATYNLPLIKESIIGHGEIQHTPKGQKWPRQTLGKKNTPEGQEFKNFILENWDSFTERVNMYKKNELSKENML